MPETSAIRTPDDLEGATIGAPDQSSAAYLYGKGVLVEAGLDPNSDAEFLPVGYGAPVADAFEKGEIDVYAGYDGPNVVIGDLLGEPLRDIESPLNNLSATSTLIVSKESLEDNPKDVVGAARAFFKAMVFSEANPEAAVQMHWEQFPQAKPVGLSDEEAMTQSVEALRLRLDITAGPGAGEATESRSTPRYRSPSTSSLRWACSRSRSTSKAADSSISPLSRVTTTSTLTRSPKKQRPGKAQVTE